jgi:hypothetical protein
VTGIGAITRDRINQIAIFLIALVCYAYFFPRWADPNQNSRLNMVVAIVDDGTFQIDKYVANTVDYAKVNGHYYSDKAPGVAFLGVPLYAGLRVVLDLPVMGQLTERLGNSAAFKETLRESGSGVLEDKVRFALAQVVLSFLTNAVPTALLCVLIYRLLARFWAGQGSRIFVALAYGLLTPAFAYANAYYGHQLSAVLLFAGFYLLFPFDPSQNPGSAKPNVIRMLSVGLLLGYSVVTEFPAALIAGILTLYALYVSYRVGALTRAAPMIAGLAICAAGLMLYNTAVFGGPFKLGYSNSELWTAQHSAGFMSLTMPGWEAASGITFSLFRGLFVLSPVLLLAVPGFVMWWRCGRLRAAFWVTLLSTLSMFLFNASSVMWWGGFAIGPRYVLPGLPFMALAIAFAIDPATTRQTQPAIMQRTQRPAVWLLGLIAVLALWSFSATWGMTLAEQAFPSDAFRINPYIEHALPNWQAGNIARSLGTIAGFKGAAALMPLAALIAALGAGWWLASAWAARPTGLSHAASSTSMPADRLSESARPAADSTV